MRTGAVSTPTSARPSAGTNIKSADLTSKDGAVFGSVLVEVENHTHLHKVLRAVRKVKGVTDIARRDSGHTELSAG